MIDRRLFAGCTLILYTISVEAIFHFGLKQYNAAGPTSSGLSSRSSHSIAVLLCYCRRAALAVSNQRIGPGRYHGPGEQVFGPVFGDEDNEAQHFDDGCEITVSSLRNSIALIFDSLQLI